MGFWWWTKKKTLKTIPLFNGWKLIKEESDWEHAKRIAGLKEVLLGREGKGIGDKGDNGKRV